MYASFLTSTYVVFQLSRALKTRVKTTAYVNYKIKAPSASVTRTIAARHNGIATMRLRDAKTFARGSVKTIPTLFVRWTITRPIASVNQDLIRIHQMNSAQVSYKYRNPKK